MCGRYTLAEPGLIAERFDAAELPEPLFPTFNAAPTRRLPVVVRNSPNRIALMRWGLIPCWAKDAAIGNRMINARAETLAEKPAFKRPLKSQRCLVPATGFYEWRREGKVKQPYLFGLTDEPIFAFAGLWDAWRDPASGDKVYSYTVITSAPNPLMAPIHDRMPVILDRHAESIWLDPTVDDPELLVSLLKPYPAEPMTAFAVSRSVNSVANDGPELIEPLPAGA